MGVVLQAYLRRTVDDIRALADLEPSVRLCKGIYVESPMIAFPDFDAVRANFVKALEALLDAGAYVGIATHDEWLVDEGRRIVAERVLETSEYEFQMLLGVRRDLGDRLVADGHRLRIYVPFGRHWYAYSLRRLQENPKIAGYIAADAIGRVPRRPPLRWEFLDHAGRALLSVCGDTDAVGRDEAEAGKRRRQLCRRVHLVGVLPVSDHLLRRRAGRDCAQPPVEEAALAWLIGDHAVAEAPPELERNAAAGDRHHRGDRAAGSVRVR